jgi:large subunit ribosomal protein L29
MTRLGTGLVSACLGVFLFATSGCEDKQCQDSLSSCRNEMSNLQKTSATQETQMKALKDQLAQSQAKIQELTTELESQKGGKGAGAKEEKGKAAEKDAKAEPAKTEKKAEKPEKAEKAPKAEKKAATK